MTIREYFDRLIHDAHGLEAIDRIYDEMEALYDAYQEDDDAMWDEFIIGCGIDTESARGMAALEAWCWDMCGD